MCAERISEKEREKWRRRPCVTQELEVWVWRHKSEQWGKKRAIWRNRSTFTATVPGHWYQVERMEKSRQALTSKQIRWLHMPGQECGHEGGCLRKQGAPASTPALSSPLLSHVKRPFWGQGWPHLTLHPPGSRRQPSVHSRRNPEHVCMLTTWTMVISGWLRPQCPKAVHLFVSSLSTAGHSLTRRPFLN